MEWTLGVGAALSVLAAAAFAYAGWRFSAARRPQGDRLAARAFVAWWTGISGYTLLVAAVDAGAWLGVADPSVYVAWRVLSFPILAFALWGLLSYFAYLFTGRRAWIGIAAALYVALGLAATAGVLLIPHEVHVGAWRVDVLPEENAPGWWRALALLFLLPPVLGAAAYLTLARKAADPAQRRRVLLVGGAILLWSLSALAARLASADLWQFVTRDVVGLLVVWAVLAAYRAPGKPQAPDGLEGLRRRVAELV